MRKLTVAALLLTLCVSPVFAQTVPPGTEVKPAGEETSRAECDANFKVADKNGDGRLSADEVEAAEGVIPTDLALTGPISYREFMDSCTAIIPRGG